MPTATTKPEVSIEEARKIMDSFGPCTVLYECSEPKEVIASIRNDHAGNIREFVQTRFEREKVHLEREHSWMADEFPVAHRKAVRDAKTFISELKTRLREAGYRVR